MSPHPQETVWIWSHLLKKFLIENFAISAVMESLKTHFIIGLTFLIKNTCYTASFCFILREAHAKSLISLLSNLCHPFLFFKYFF